MRRRQQVTDGPPIPERLAVYRWADWPVRGRRGEDPLAVGVRSYRRWLDARRVWEAETGVHIPRSWERAR